MSEEFKELVSLTVGGQQIKVLATDRMLVEGPSAVKTAIIGETVEELQTQDCLRVAVDAMMKSVQRRGITPKGTWIVGHLPVDDPLWRDSLDTNVVSQVEAGLEELGGGHVAVFFLSDSETLKAV